MKTKFAFKYSLLAVAISVAFPNAQVFADEVEELINPNAADVSMRLQQLDRVNPLYRQYTGINQKDLNGSLDIDYVDRNQDGRWVKIEASNLGLATQEFNASVEQQGDWAVGIGYNQIPRYAPFVVNSRVEGIGTNSLTLPGGSLPTTVTATNTSYPKYDFKTERTATSFNAEKYFGPNYRFSFGFKSEDKKGERVFGSYGNSISNGSGGSYSTLLFTPEPIDSKHQQFEAVLDYFSKEFQMSAGYYGSYFKNNAGAGLYVSPYDTDGRTDNTINTSYYSRVTSPYGAFALAPDNHVNQFFVSAAYNVNQDTRATLKATQSYGVQDANFLALSPDMAKLATSATYCSLNPATVTAATTASADSYCPLRLNNRANLGAEVETSNIVGSLTSKITKDLGVLLSWSYQDVNDKTPVDYYVSSAGTLYTNNPDSTTTNRGKAELTYRFGNGYRATLGTNYDEKKFKEGLRAQVEEMTYRVDLGKTLSETLNGNLQYAFSSRTGSGWEQTNLAGSVMYADRARDKVRTLLDWSPVDSLNVQFSYELSKDDYTNVVSSNGLDKSNNELYSLDAQYQFNDNWKGNVWVSQSHSKMDQVKPVSNTNGALNWGAELTTYGSAIGFGLQGKLTAKADVGVQYLYSRDKAGAYMYGTGANSAVVPDTQYSVSTARVYGKYQLAKGTALRVDYINDRRTMDDYTWANWIYSDGTTVYVKPVQTTQILGLSLIQSF